MHWSPCATCRARAGVKLFLSAAARKPGVAQAVEAAKAAFQEFDALVRREAGDRRSFDMMAANHEKSGGGSLDLEHCKGAFTHNSYIWGVQARAQVHTYLIRPSDDGEHVDAAIVRGFVGLRRVRPHIPWRISRFFTVDDTGHVRSSFAREPIDRETGGDVPLLRGFCSRPTPRVRRIIGQEGVIDDVLEESDVGNTRSVTCLTGELIRKAEPCYPDERHANLGVKTPIRTPCEAVVMDLFLDRQHFGGLSPALTLVSDVFAERLGMVYTKADVLPTASQVETLGSGADAAPVPEMPRYADMMRHCFAPTRVGPPAIRLLPRARRLSAAAYRFGARYAAPRPACLTCAKGAGGCESGYAHVVLLIAADIGAAGQEYDRRLGDSTG